MLCACFDVAFLFLNFFCCPALATLAHQLAKLLILVFHHLFNSCCGYLFPFSLIALSLSLSSFGTFALIALGLIYAAAPASMQRKYFYDPIYEPSPLPCALVHLCEHGQPVGAGWGGAARPTAHTNHIKWNSYVAALMRFAQDSPGRQAGRQRGLLKRFV